MAKASYTYKVLEGLCSITDLDQGSMSVTNDIETVVDEICSREHIDAKDYKWIYRDSNGVWDGWNPAKSLFIILRTKDEAEAIKLINEHFTT